ncbi:hypothetical protein IE81DRAFT_323330 [Ceraceosorus guamensis]|uniref:Uncharacterized protein n=1 Tax=Ceraceosorus guamensis TaxID=1522189 RepID=A0A316VY31_9BASI|nr:hypothetical protein IE81DRAFT_323330 [Ceraceosorus guamensis]PWN42567.1 hypothetical protein IE81DRAFT_323330 [Ceraceosorus guamensis]
MEQSGTADGSKRAARSLIPLPSSLSSPKTVRQSPLILLSIVMIAFALLPLMDHLNMGSNPRIEMARSLRSQAEQAWLNRGNSTWDPSKYWDVETPILIGTREPSTGLEFSMDRLEKGALLYGWLHIAPAIVWSIAIPAQHSIRLRSAYPAVHKWLGRATLVSACLLTYSGVSFPFHDLSYSADLLATHRWGYLVWPSFNLVVLLAGLFWPPTVLMTYLTARKKDWKAHRAWATLHTFIGSVIPMQVRPEPVRSI